MTSAAADVISVPSVLFMFQNGGYQLDITFIFDKSLFSLAEVAQSYTNFI